MLASGTARRQALDEAVAEIDAGHNEPSYAWRVRFALMLGLERMLTGKPPLLASGTELRRHQVDALAGMLTALITANQRELEERRTATRRSRMARTRRTTTFGIAEENGQVEVADEELELAERTRRETALPLPSPDGLGEDDRGGRLRRGGPHARRPDPHAPPAARLPVHPGADGGGVRRPAPPEISRGKEPPQPNPLTIQTYAWFARHVGRSRRDAYQLVIADEAHTALGEKTSAAIRSFPEPVYIGMTATEQLIAKQVSDVFPRRSTTCRSQDAARRGLIAPLRDLRVPPAAAIHSVPIVGGDFDEGALAKVLDHEALNQAAASLYRDRFDDTPASSTPPASTTRTTSPRSSAPRA